MEVRDQGNKPNDPSLQWLFGSEFRSTVISAYLALQEHRKRLLSLELHVQP
jgi:hypothetical protein